MRHIFAALGRELHALDGYIDVNEDQVYDLQAGHSTRISDRIYAKAGDDKSRVGQMFRGLSRLWWFHVLGLRDEGAPASLQELQLADPGNASRVQHSAAELDGQQMSEIESLRNLIRQHEQTIKDQAERIKNLISSVGAKLSPQGLAPRIQIDRSPSPFQMGWESIPQRPNSQDPTNDGLLSPSPSPSQTEWVPTPPRQKGQDPRNDRLSFPPPSPSPIEIDGEMQQHDRYTPSDGSIDGNEDCGAPNSDPSHGKDFGSSDSDSDGSSSGNEDCGAPNSDSNRDKDFGSYNSDTDSSATSGSDCYPFGRRRKRDDASLWWQLGGPEPSSSHAKRPRGVEDDLESQHHLKRRRTDQNLRCPSRASFTDERGPGEDAEWHGAVRTSDIQLLRGLLGDPAAMFRSATQYRAYRNLVERRRHTVYVARTGEGKTLPIMLAAKQWEQSVKVFLVVPFIVLYEEMKSRFEKQGLPTQVCSNTEQLDPTRRVYIVGINTFAMRDFHNQVKMLALAGQIGAVMLDEADGIIVDTYRPHYLWAYLHALELPNTVLIFTSATIPTPHTREWFDILRLTNAAFPGEDLEVGADGSGCALEWDPAIESPIDAVRHRATDRLNIRYNLKPYRGLKDAFQHIEHLAKSNKKLVVYTTFPDDARKIAKCVNTDYVIDGKTENDTRAEHLKAFARDDKAVLVGTKAAYYGIDISNLQHVVVLFPVGGKKAPNLVEFLQASGRAGRGNFSAECTMLIPVAKKKLPPWLSDAKPGFGGADMLAAMITGSKCVRSTLSAHIDGWDDGATCVEMNAALQVDGRAGACYIRPCSRCSPHDLHVWQPLPPAPELPPSVDDLVDGGVKWVGWIRNIPSAPPAANTVPKIVWGTRKLALVSDPINRLSVKYQNASQRRASAVHTGSRVLHLVQPACVICFEASGDAATASAHPSSKCPDSRRKTFGPTSEMVQPDAQEITYDAWKACWADFLKDNRIKGVCFSCMLSEDPPFHSENECVYPDIAAPLVWTMRSCGEYLEHVKEQTLGMVQSLDEFDELVFGMLDEAKRGVLAGPNVVLRDWYHAVAKKHSLPQVDDIDTLESAWIEAGQAFKRQRRWRGRLLG